MNNDSKNTETVAELFIPDLQKTIKLPILRSTKGPDAIDIRKLYTESGFFTYDPGFMSTASCRSSITYIDGNEGILQHCGHDIAQLARNQDYIDVAYLLLYKNLPNESEKSKFMERIYYHSLVHEQLQFLYRGFPRSAHPMAIMIGAVASLSAFYHDTLNIHDKWQCEEAGIKLLAKIPTLAAMAHKYAIGQPFVHPDNSLSYSGNLLNMMFSIPIEKYQVDPVLSRALDQLLILHADHEQNASTSTVRLAGSSDANPFTVIGAGISSLWGPAHGGANEAVIKMLEAIGSPSHIPQYIDKVKDKKTPFRLMGFGHRVYKNYDPRAAVLKKSCSEVLNALSVKDDALLEIALKLEEIALKDEYFVKRKLYPNVDFYSGIIYRALGIPTSMFTVMFAVARTAGWVAQWREMLEDSEKKIGRPRQLYVGK